MKNLLSQVLDGKFEKIGFFGLGKSNLSLISILAPLGAEITLRSESDIDESLLPPEIKYSRILSGKNAFSDISEDILFLSPSVRRERKEFTEAALRGVLLSSDAELFFLGVGKREVFAVSGSDGKSTTSTLLAKLLEGDNKVGLIGNVGVPMLESLSSECDIFVAELSSFMLRYINPRVRRAAITNITPNHLNWHASFEEYRDTKLSLLKNAEEAVLSVDDKILREYCLCNDVFAITSAKESYAKLKNAFKSKLYITFEADYICKNGEPLISINDIRRKEEYNLKNLMCAVALADGYYSLNHLLKVAREFSGLPHRAQTVLEHNGVEYIDSSIDTSPDRANRTILSLKKQVILILGGRGKGADYKALSSAVSLYAKRVIIYGEDREKIYSALSQYAACEVCEAFEPAVTRACELAEPTDTVLLSPAATSYDAFRSFEERAEKFKEIIKNYYKL